MMADFSSKKKNLLLHHKEKYKPAYYKYYKSESVYNPTTSPRDRQTTYLKESWDRAFGNFILSELKLILVTMDKIARIRKYLYVYCIKLILVFLHMKFGFSKHIKPLFDYYTRSFTWLPPRESQQMTSIITKCI